MRSQQVISKTAAYGKGGSVAAARQASVDAGILMLEQGGNAMDAAVAAAWVAGVLEPMETTLAGSGFMLVAKPDGKVNSVEFGARAPLAAHKDMYTMDEGRVLDRGLGVSTVLNDENVHGIRAAGVPTTIAGLTAAHAQFGKLPLPTVMQPAIAVAHDGFPADTYFALEALDNLQGLRADQQASQLFLVNGLPPTSAHLGAATLGQPTCIKQANLGRTLEQIAAHGPGAFYAGPLGQALLESHRELGGLLSLKDLHQVKPDIKPARRFRFRDVDVWTPHSPCGAITQLQILNIWQALYPENGPTEDSAERLIHLAKANWHAFADRYHWLGDPDFVPVPEQGLLSPAYAREIAKRILDGSPAPRCAFSQTPWNFFAGHAAHDPWTYESSQHAEPVVWSPGGASEPTAGTTHISAVDEAGMTVSLTHTAANHFGAKVVCPRTGLLLDAAMGWFNARPNAANSIEGGKRPLANMGPMVLTRDGQSLAALGAPGGRRIIAAVVQLVLNVVERQMTAVEAVHAPRIDASGTTLLASERLQPLANDLGELSNGVRWVAEQNQGFGYELARPVIVVQERGVSYPATDPFTQGFAASRT